MATSAVYNRELTQVVQATLLHEMQTANYVPCRNIAQIYKRLLAEPHRLDGQSQAGEATQDVLNLPATWQSDMSEPHIQTKLQGFTSMVRAYLDRPSNQPTNTMMMTSWGIQTMEVVKSWISQLFDLLKEFLPAVYTAAQRQFMAIWALLPKMLELAASSISKVLGFLKEIACKIPGMSYLEGSVERIRKAYVDWKSDPNDKPPPVDKGPNVGPSDSGGDSSSGSMTTTTTTTTTPVVSSELGTKSDGPIFGKPIKVHSEAEMEEIVAARVKEELRKRDLRDKERLDFLSPPPSDSKDPVKEYVYDKFAVEMDQYGLGNFLEDDESDEEVFATEVKLQANDGDGLDEGIKVTEEVEVKEPVATPLSVDLFATLATSLTAIMSTVSDGLHSTKFDVFNRKLFSVLSWIVQAERVHFLSHSKRVANALYCFVTGNDLFAEFEIAKSIGKLYQAIDQELNAIELLKNPPYSQCKSVQLNVAKFKKFVYSALEMYPQKQTYYNTLLATIEKRTGNIVASAMGSVPRMKPVSVVMFGKSGIGKNDVQDVIMQTLMPLVKTLMDQQVGMTDMETALYESHCKKSGVFVRNCMGEKEEYMDGYQNQLVEIFEEYLTSNQQEINVEWANEFLAHIGYASIRLNMAFQNKGQVFFDSPFVFANGNALESGHVISVKDKDALYRRIDFDLQAFANSSYDGEYDVMKSIVFKFSKEAVDMSTKAYAPNGLAKLVPFIGKTMTDMFTFIDILKLIALVYVERVRSYSLREGIDVARTSKVLNTAKIGFSLPQHLKGFNMASKVNYHIDPKDMGTKLQAGDCDKLPPGEIITLFDKRKVALNSVNIFPVCVNHDVMMRMVDRYWTVLNPHDPLFSGWDYAARDVWRFSTTNLFSNYVFFSRALKSTCEFAKDAKTVRQKKFFCHKVENLDRMALALKTALTEASDNWAGVDRAAQVRELKAAKSSMNAAEKEISYKATGGKVALTPEQERDRARRAKETKAYMDKRRAANAARIRERNRKRDQEREDARRALALAQPSTVPVKRAKKGKRGGKQRAIQEARDRKYNTKLQAGEKKSVAAEVLSKARPSTYLNGLASGKTLVYPEEAKLSHFQKIKASASMHRAYWLARYRLENVVAWYNARVALPDVRQRSVCDPRMYVNQAFVELVNIAKPDWSEAIIVSLVNRTEYAYINACLGDILDILDKCVTEVDFAVLVYSFMMDTKHAENDMKHIKSNFALLVDFILSGCDPNYVFLGKRALAADMPIVLLGYVYKRFSTQESDFADQYLTTTYQDRLTVCVQHWEVNEDTLLTPRQQNIQWYAELTVNIVGGVVLGYALYKLAKMIIAYFYEPTKAEMLIDLIIDMKTSDWDEVVSILENDETMGRLVTDDFAEGVATQGTSGSEKQKRAKRGAGTKPGKRYAEKVKTNLQAGLQSVQVRQKMMRNLYFLTRPVDGELVANCLFLKGSICVMNDHVYKSRDDFQFCSYVQGLCGRDFVEVDKSQMVVLGRMPDRDLIYLSIPGMRRHGDITNFFLSRDAYYKRSQAIMDVAMLTIDLNSFAPVIDPIAEVRIRPHEKENIDDEITPTYVFDRYTYAWRGSKPGACGTPLTAEVASDLVIMGIHAAGQPAINFGVGVPIWTDDFKLFEDTQNAGVRLQCGDTMSFLDRDLVGAYDISTKHEFVTPIRTSPSNVSQFKKTVFTKQSFRGGPEKIPADLTREAYANCLLKEEEIKGMNKESKEATLLARTFQDKLMEGFVDVPTRSLLDCQTLTFDEAMWDYGNLGSFDFSTAQGIRLKMLGIDKRNLADPNSEDSAKLRVVVDQYIESFKRGEFTYQVNVDCLKDELRPVKRVAEKKTRLFNVTDFVDNVLLKMAVGDLVNKLKRLLLLTPACCGINPTCSMWAQIFAKFAPPRQVVFSDIFFWDGTMLLWLTWVVLPWLTRLYGGDPNSFRVRFAHWAFISCIMALRFTGNRGRLNGAGNSSGNWLTTFWNTICNFIFHEMAAIFLAAAHGVPLGVVLNQLRVILYSDDNISHLPFPWWNLYNVKMAFEHLFGIRLTSTDKTEITADGKTYTIVEADFLSRGFRKHKGVVYAPLSQTSLLSQLYYVRVPANMATPGFVDSQLQINLDNVARELMEYEPAAALAILTEIREFLQRYAPHLEMRSQTRSDLLQAKEDCY